MLPQNSYKLSDRSTIRNLENILKILDDVKPILIGGMAVAAYASHYGLPYNRETKDLDFVIKKDYEIYTKEVIYRELQNLPIREGKIFRYNGIEIIYKYGPKVSILFRDGEIPYNEIKLKFGKKEIKLYVAIPEYLLVDKIFTYLDRKERKDLEDIKVLCHLMKKYGYDKELLYKIFNEYSSKYRKYSSKAKYIIEKIFI